MSFRRNNLKYILWKKTIVNNKVPKIKTTNKKGYLKPCYSKTGSLFGKYFNQTNTFLSTVTKKTYKIYNKLNCKSNYLIYLMECICK